MKLFNDKENKVVVGFSPQSVSSLAHYASALSNTAPDEFTTFKKLQSVFKKLGAEMVLDLSLFQGLSLELAY